MTSHRLSIREKYKGSRIAPLLAVLGPGIIVAMVDTDAGGIATYSVAGAKYGYAILWVMIPTAVLLFMVQEMNARMGVTTGKGLASLIREKFSFRLTAFIMLAMLMANFANTISDFAGIAASSEIFGVRYYIAVPVAAAAIWWLVLRGTYKVVEKVFLVASLVYVAYIISSFMAAPEWSKVARGFLVPSGQMSASYIVMVITIIGTTIAPWMQFYQQSSIVDKGLSVKELAYERVDTGMGTVAAVIVGLAIMVACAAAFFNNPHVGSTQIETAEQAARALGPIAGEYAKYLFAFGLLSASIFAASVLPLATAYTVCEAFGWEYGIDRSFAQARRFYTVYTAFIIGGAAVVLVPRAPLITLMIFSQTINGLLLPVVLTCMLLIIRDRDVMGDYVNGDTYNTVAWVAVFILYVLDAWLVVATVFPVGR